MISKLKLDRIHRCRQLLLAASVSGLMLMPVANAGQPAPGYAPAPQGTGNSYAGSTGAVPPPPGPYSAAPGGGNFRPDPDLEGAGSRMPPPYPAEFSNRNGRGSLTRQQFIEQQEAHRKQMDKYYQQREAEMNKRVEDMQKRMDAMQKQDEATFNSRYGNVKPPVAEKMQNPEEVQKRWEQQNAEQDRLWEQQKAEQERRWEEQKAAQEKHMKQVRAERDKRRKEMKAQQEQWANAHSQYRPQGVAPAPATQARKNPVQPPVAPAPAYGYPPRGYGYGYPPPPYGYRGPVRPYAYPQYPAPAAGGRQGAR